MDTTLTVRPKSGTTSDKAAPDIQAILLLLAGSFIFANLLALFLQQLQPRYLLIGASWALSAYAGHRVLKHRLSDFGRLLFPLVMFLSGWGLVLISRLEPTFADRQAVWLLIATGALLWTATTPHLLRWLRLYRYLLLIFGLMLLISTILLGQNPSGQAGAPQLWLGFGAFFFQPSEALKVILVAFLASYLSEQYPNLRAAVHSLEPSNAWLSPRIIGPVLLMWTLSVVILIWQRDLGTASLFFAVFIILLYVASGRIMIVLGGAILTLIAGFVAYNLFAVVELRVDIWLNPWPDADNRAYQIVQSLMAFGAGGIFGQGIGQGTPNFIPVVHSDFVFAALAEEYGLLGVVSLLSLIAAYTARGLRIAVLSQARPFYSLLALGLTMLITVQSLLIMGGVLKLFPLTGVTLPFVSYGGSSLLMSFIVTGLLLRLSAEVR